MSQEKQETVKVFVRHLTEDQLKAQIVELNRKLEVYKLVASYAQDVVNYWPLMTFRTIRIMIPKMDALKEALELASK